jgi:hypothetical protein
MKLQTLAAACAVVVSLTTAQAAFAGDAITAKLQQPVAEKTKLIAGGAVFLCEADACVAQTPSSQTFATGACKAIASKVGAIASFGDARKQLEAGRLTDCNTVARAAGSQLAKQ